MGLPLFPCARPRGRAPWPEVEGARARLVVLLAALGLHVLQTPRGCAPVPLDPRGFTGLGESLILSAKQPLTQTSPRTRLVAGNMV